MPCRRGGREVNREMGNCCLAITLEHNGRLGMTVSYLLGPGTYGPLTVAVVLLLIAIALKESK